MKEIGKRVAPSSPRILELKKKRRKILRTKIIFFSVIILIIIVGLFFLSRWQAINIVSVEVRGNKIIETKAIDEIVKSEISGHYLWFIPKSNFLLLPKSKIKDRLANELKRLEDIEIEVKDTRVLEISVSERKALYTWCGESLDFYTQEILSFSDEADKTCYFINESGYIFDKAPYFSGDVYFKFFGPLTKSTESPLGQNYAPEIFDKLVIFIDGLKDLGLKPESLIAKSENDIELYLKSNSFRIDGNKIVFDINSDVTKLLENLHASISTLPLKSELEEKYEELLYIDLRFGNKIYYKFR